MRYLHWSWLLPDTDVWMQKILTSWIWMQTWCNHYYRSIQKAWRLSSPEGGQLRAPCIYYGNNHLKSNVNLYLENGAVLLEAQKSKIINQWYYQSSWGHNIALSDGAIDARVICSGLIQERGRLLIVDHLRNLVQLEGCKNVIIENIILRGSEAGHYICWHAMRFW